MEGSRVTFQVALTGLRFFTSEATGLLLAGVERKKNGIAKMTEPEPSAEADAKGENRQSVTGG